MSTVYAGSSDCRVGSGGRTSWSDARTLGGAFASTNSNFAFGIYNVYTGGRGTNNYFIVRSFFGFDLSGLSGTLTDATISIYAKNLGTTDDPEATIHLYEATSVPTGTSGFTNIFSSGTTFGTALGSTTTHGLQYHDVTVSSGGITAINNQIGSGTFAVAAVGDFDNSNTAPSLGGDFVRIHIYYSESSGTSNDPKLTLTFASGYTHTVLGVAAANIGSVNGVATADIGKVIGVD